MATPQIIAGNWKMNLLLESSTKLISDLKKGGISKSRARVIIIPPATLLSSIADQIKNTGIFLGAQNCHEELKGAFTGEVSAEMLASVGCNYVILGHSERRTLFNETDEIVCRKALFALKNSMSVTFCVGESLNERESNETESVLRRQLGSLLSRIDLDQLNRIIVAYEPIWAIGTGLTANVEQISQAHGILRDLVRESFGKVADQLTIQYGGSVNENNSEQLSEIGEVDGFLIGGASKSSKKFIDIIKNYYR